MKTHYGIEQSACLPQAGMEHSVETLYPVRNNAPLPCSGALFLTGLCAMRFIIVGIN